MKGKYEQYLENYFTNFVKHKSMHCFVNATYGIDTLSPTIPLFQWSCEPILVDDFSLVSLSLLFFCSDFIHYEWVQKKARKWAEKAGANYQR